ncbi:MAG: hypothetical protein ACTFAL_02410 [Candidatus Electronema sp. V4]|uniref:hypothetical protein n=1 Tax=Candidatus Electronema sp. V4 TaxID=3454756 RepID=UPI004055374E
MNSPATYDVVKEMLGTKGTPYSPEAETKIEDFSADYGEQLVLEAARLASREGLQQISTGHVDDAKRRLRSIELNEETGRKSSMDLLEGDSWA